MLTIFSTARSFQGLYAVIQRNAITSWTKLEPRPQIILFGDDDGTGELCEELGIEHVPDVKLSDQGTPLISDMFDRAQAMAHHDVCCLVNSDIILFDSIHDTVRRVRERFAEFLVVGQRWDLDIDQVLRFDDGWQDDLHRAIEQSGHRQSETGIDYFLFPTGQFGELPPFAIGRTAYDNWVIWRAGDLGVPVVDATRFLEIIHQNHDYSHGGGTKAVWEGPEARRAHDLVGHWSHYHGISHARFLITQHGEIQPATGLRYRVARPRRAVLHTLRFTRPMRRRLRAIWYRVRMARKHGAEWKIGGPAMSFVARWASRRSRTRPIVPVPGYQFGQVLVSRGARTRFLVWAVGRFVTLDEPVIVEWNGLHVASYLGNDLSRCLYVGGTFEPNELAFVSSVLGPGQVMVDVGANEGLYTLLSAASVGPEGSVLAIEPSPREARRLRDNVRRNALGQVTIVEKLLLDETRPAVLQVADRHHAGQNTLGEFVYDGVTTAAQVEVEATTLDELLGEVGIEEVRLIKVDVEGAETMVMRGAHDVLRRQRPLLLMELQEASLRHQGSSVAELLDVLHDAGYRVFPFSDRSGRPTTRELVGNGSLNVVSCPSELVEELIDEGVLES